MADPMPLNQALETLRIIVAQQKAMADLGGVLEAAAELEAKTVALSVRHDALAGQIEGLELQLANLREKAAAADVDYQAQIAELDRLHGEHVRALEAEVKDETAKAQKRIRDKKAAADKAEEEHGKRLEALAAEQAEAETKTRAAQEAYEQYLVSTGAKAAAA